MKLTEHELTAIEQAVDQVESKYPVELVPVFTDQSASYPIGRLRALIVGLLLGICCLFLLDSFGPWIWSPLYLKVLFSAVFGASVVLFIDVVPSLTRLVIGKQEMFAKTYEQARLEFVDHEVYSNPNRLGVLLYISVKERQFHILCDKKGSNFFTDEDWQKVSKKLSVHLKQKAFAQAVQAGIEEIELVLAQEIEPSSELAPSILPNHLRYEE